MTFKMFKFKGPKEISGYWELTSRIGSDTNRYFAITNATSQIGYPVGRHAWLVTDHSCDLGLTA